MLPLLQWPKKERAAERSASPRDVLMKDDPDEQQRVRGLEEVMLPSPPKASSKDRRVGAPFGRSPTRECGPDAACWPASRGTRGWVDRRGGGGLRRRDPGFVTFVRALTRQSRHDDRTFAALTAHGGMDSDGYHRPA